MDYQQNGVLLKLSLRDSHEFIKKLKEGTQSEILDFGKDIEKAYASGDWPFQWFAYQYLMSERGLNKIEIEGRLIIYEKDLNGNTVIEIKPETVVDHYYFASLRLVALLLSICMILIFLPRFIYTYACQKIHFYLIEKKYQETSGKLSDREN